MELIGPFFLCLSLRVFTVIVVAVVPLAIPVLLTMVVVVVVVVAGTVRWVVAWLGVLVRGAPHNRSAFSVFFEKNHRDENPYNGSSQNVNRGTP